MADEIRGSGSGENIEDNVNVVGVAKSKKLFVIIVVLIATGLMYYFFFFNKESSENEEDTQIPRVIEEKEVEKLRKDAGRPAQETAPRILTPPPRLPELPPLVMPTVPDIPVVTKLLKPPVEEEFVEEYNVQEVPSPMGNIAPPEREEISLPLPYKTIATEQPSFLGYDKEKRGAPMIAFGGGGEAAGSESGDGSVGGKEDARFTAWQGLEGTQSPSVRATRVGDTRYIILQGHMIDAVLETAINSDISGVLRAVVSRDVYASSGDAVVIPKGSRLIGSYFFDSAGNNVRVDVNWSRVILPHGVDIQIASSGTDELGRNGISGVVDNKVGSILTSTIFLAGISLGTAYVTDQIPSLRTATVKVETPADGKDGKKTTSSSLSTKIVSDAIKDFSDSMKEIVNKYSNRTPTVYVDQGTVMKVFVNQDVVFPRDAVR
ncbi:TrbI/VirB10 family protein [Anaplasma phagocytophilum]|uniref:TrbI/VirB10 family protein n=1 Tax=Anaplasma phagocytophilum TaxID=948 RepID=UPI003D96822B